MKVTRIRGDTSPDSFTITNQKTRAVVNLTGCSFKLTVNSNPDPVDDSTQIMQMTGVVSDPATGIVQFSPTLEQANHVGYFYFDVQMTDLYGKVQTLVKDIYVFEQDITK